MDNQKPPCAVYIAFMSGRLIALDNLPSVHPVCVGETWRQIFANWVLKITGPEATHACKDDQLCTGLKVVIGGAVHGVNLFGTLALPRKIGVFYLFTQRTPLMRSIKLECCGRFAIYGRLDLVLFLNAFVPITHSN